jgi:hypothetical protein
VSSNGAHVWVANHSGDTVSEIIPPPVLGKSVDAAPVAGVVLLKQPGKKTFTRLRAGEQIPVGSSIDATGGAVSLTAALNGKGKTTDSEPKAPVPGAHRVRRDAEHPRRGANADRAHDRPRFFGR